ncbi:AraC family transcriptional regulator [Pseudonocardiaceae bacterium YIM PH 21723]|nr:AraC family transcriptional regulator [Pseudonocardiaceae bacterium YIM PH 21723]
MAKPHKNDDEYFVTRLPRRDLTEHIVCYMGYERTLHRPVTRRLAALGSVLMLIELDSPHRGRVAGTPQPPDRSPVVGLTDRPLLFTQYGRERGLLAELTPLGARALLGLPLRLISNTAVCAADLLGTEAGRLSERLIEARTWADRFQLLDEQLGARIHSGAALPSQVQGAWQELLRSAGRMRINTLAERVGWTRQHLNTRFREQIGLSPKAVARVARFHAAIRLATRPRPPSWAEVAASCGYSDQSHLHRDFRLLTGHGPTELLASANSRGSAFTGTRQGTRLVSQDLCTYGSTPAGETG